MAILAGSIQKSNNDAKDDHQSVIIQRAQVAIEHGWHLLTCDAHKRPTTAHGVNDATTNLATVAGWVAAAPDAMLALAPGASGVVALDFDLYETPKSLSEIAREIGLDLALCTVAQVTPRGGLHLLFKMPPGRVLGCGRGDLPSYIDVRGNGGYILLYDDALTRINVANLPLLPDAIAEKLPDARQNATEARSGDFSKLAGKCATRPDLSRYGLSLHVRQLIERGVAKGQRSDALWRVARAMVEAGADDAEIAAVILAYPIGSKVRAKGRHRDKYLATLIGKARVKVDDPAHVRHRGPRVTTATPRAPLKGAGYVSMSPLLCANVLREHGVCNPDSTVALVATLLDISRRQSSTTITTSTRALVMGSCLARSTARRHLVALEAADLVVVERTTRGITIAADALITALATAQPPENVGSGPSLHSLFAELPITHDCFASTPYGGIADNGKITVGAIHRRASHGPLLASFGARGRTLLDALQHGGTVAELVAITKLCERTVRGLLARFKAAGILYISTRGRAHFYELHPNVVERIFDAMPNMTTYGIGNLRQGRAHCEQVLWAKRQLIKGRADLPDAQKEWLRQRIERTWARIEHCYNQAAHDFKLSPRRTLTRLDMFDFFAYLEAPGSNL